MHGVHDAPAVNDARDGCGTLLCGAAGLLSRLSNGANVSLTDDRSDDRSVLARWYDCAKWAVVVASIDLSDLWSLFSLVGCGLVFKVDSVY